MNNFNGGFNFNPQAGAMMAQPDMFRSYTDLQILEQLKSLAAYGSHNHTTLMLMAELYHRSAHAFGKTFIPTKTVHGDSYLYTSIFKNGRMTHFFVRDQETKDKIQAVLDGATKHPFEENISLLVELGPVFEEVMVDENGAPIGEPRKAGFPALFGFDGFAAQPQHVSKTLPLAVLELSFMAAGSFSQGVFNELLMNGIRMATDDKELHTRVDHYLRSFNALLEYKKSTDSVISEPGSLNLVPITTQIHFFPVDQDSPIKFVSALYAEKDPRFIDRSKFPHLFVNPIAHYNQNAFNGTGFAPGGPHRF